MEQNKIKESPNKTAKIQKYLSENSILALIIRSTDQYFNEYVPEEKSIRVAITGFKGSVGDAVITKDSAHLFVDGRYALQAKMECPDYQIIVAKSGLSIEANLINFLSQLAKREGLIAYDPSTTDLSLFEKLNDALKPFSISLVPKAPEIFSLVLKDFNKIEKFSYYQIPDNISGDCVYNKTEKLRTFLHEKNLDAIFLRKLDDIAYLSNLRSDFFPFSTCMPAKAFVHKDGLIIGFDHEPSNGYISKTKGLSLVDHLQLDKALKEGLSKNKPLNIGIDTKECSKKDEMDLKEAGFKVSSIDNPVPCLKSIKNEKELLHMRQSIKRADQAVDKTINFVISSMEKEDPISEFGVKNFLEEQYVKGGAKSLSFRPICAHEKNAAIIHYGNPQKTPNIKKGALFLLDTGAYYEGGYATDLTRTFLADIKEAKAEEWQKKMFTLVLKASIRGLSARIKRQTLGRELDAIVREPLWKHGLDFAHGTGHGVGINVHEFPPRIAPYSNTTLLEHQVFSIEPGLYFEGIGGVRIENLVTLVKDPKNDDFLRVLPLSFCPFDERLIEQKMLDEDEKIFLAYYKKEWLNDAPMPSLPPLLDSSF